jgi:cyclin-dependent kinase 2
MAVMERYLKMEKLGEGTYGVVYKAQDLQTKEIVAVKKITVHDDDGEGIQPTTLREISLLRELQHPNIVLLNNVIQDHDRNIQLVFEFSEHDLKKIIDRSRLTGGIPPHMVKSYMFQLLQGLTFCHSHRVLHRDLKPANLLIDRHGSLKIADFGLARAFTVPLHTYTHDVFTRWYRAPEILLGSRHYSTPADIWAAGCILAELATSEPLFPGECEIDQLFRIFRSMGTPGVEGCWPDAAILPNFVPLFPRWAPTPLAAAAPSLSSDGVALLEQLLLYAPAARLSARSAIASPYFDSIRQCSGGSLSSAAIAADGKSMRGAQAAGLAALPPPVTMESMRADVVGAVRRGGVTLEKTEAGLETEIKTTRSAAPVTTAALVSTEVRC